MWAAAITLAPFLDIGAHPRVELLRRRRLGVDAEIERALLQVRVRENVVQRRVQLVDDGLGRARRRVEPVPSCHLELGDAGFLHGRNVRQLKRALRPARRDGARLAAVESRLERGVEIDRHLDIVAQQRHHDVGRGAKRHHDDIDAGHRFEQFGGEILRAADSDGADIERTGLFVRGLEEITERLECATMRCTDKVTLEIADRGNRHELLERIERQMIEQRHADRRAVGRSVSV